MSEPVTDRVNILRGSGIAAECAAKTHCPAGHPYDEANTIVTPSRPNARYCRECNRIRGREYQRKRRLMLRERRQAACT